MKILFIGTGVGETLKIDGESLVDGPMPCGLELLRGPSSILLEPDIRIDYSEAGPLARFGVDEQSVRHLVMTHGHTDHLLPQPLLAFAARQPLGLEVYGNHMVIDAIAFAARHRWDAERGRFYAQKSDAELRFHPIRAGDTFAIGNARFTALLSNHFIDKVHMIQGQQALNYVIEQGGKTFFYGLDSAYPLPETMEVLKDYCLDAAVFDAKGGAKEIDRTRGHMNFAIVDELVTELRHAGTITDNTVVLVSHLSLEATEPFHEIAADMTARGFRLAYAGLRLAL